MSTVQPPPPGDPGPGPGPTGTGTGPGPTGPGPGTRTGSGTATGTATGTGPAAPLPKGSGGTATATSPDDAQAALQDRISSDSLTTRRDYLRIVATVSGGLAVGGLAVAGGVLHRHGEPDTDGTPEPKRIAGGLEPGESLAFRYPGDEDRAVAVRLADGSLVGYSAVCTHLACAVLWRKERGTEGELYCPCHEGVFDARTGEVTAGPPPRGLPKVVVVEERDGSIWAIGTTRSGESVEAALCRQIIDERPEFAARIGCPGATSPQTPGTDPRQESRQT